MAKANIENNLINTTMSRVWLTALEETSRDFFGANPINFMHQSYHHAFETLLKIADEEMGISISSHETMKDSLEEILNFFIKIGFFTDASQIEIKIITPSRCQLNLYNCRNKKTCLDLINMGFSSTNITCPTMGLLIAALQHVSSQKYTYEPVSLSPDKGLCTGYLLKV